jgi:hypothetical protein
MAAGERMSTGLCNMLLGGVAGAGSLKTIIDGNFKLYIYGGTVPASADAVATVATGNPILCIVANAGAPVTMDVAAVNGVIAKKPSETWSGTNADTGNATFYRFQTTADTGAVSGTLPRIQGTIGVGGADMNVGTIALVSGNTFTVNYFTQALVPS